MFAIPASTFFFLHLTIEEESKYVVQKYCLLTPKKKKKTVSLFDRCVQRLTSRRPLPQLSSCHSFINRKKKKKTDRAGRGRKKKKKRKSAFPKVVGEKKKKNKQTNKKILFPSLASVKNRKKERGERRIKTPLALTCLTGWGARGGNDKKRHIG